MAIRLLATYEFFDKNGHPAGTVRLPVVDYAQPDPDGRERPRVLLLSGDDPYLVDCSSPSATTASAPIPGRSAPATCRASCVTGARTRPTER
jgi:hypothetical protein